MQIKLKSEEAVQALSALAQDSRLAIFRLLVQQGPDGLPAGTIAKTLNLPLATLSFHLQQLSKAGLVSSHREGRYIFYAANYSQMNSLIAYLSENCCRGVDRLNLNSENLSLNNCKEVLK